MTNHLDAQILTPEGALFKGEADGIRMPGADGSFEVKPMHAPLISTLKPGVIIVREVGGGETRFAVSGGLVEVHDNMLNLLAEAAEPINKIDVERAREAKQRAEQRLKDAASDSSIDVERAQSAKDRAENRINLSMDITSNMNTD